MSSALGLSLVCFYGPKLLSRILRDSTAQTYFFVDTTAASSLPKNTQTGLARFMLGKNAFGTAHIKALDLLLNFHQISAFFFSFPLFHLVLVCLAHLCFQCPLIARFLLYHSPGVPKVLRSYVVHIYSSTWEGGYSLCNRQMNSRLAKLDENTSEVGELIPATCYYF